MRVRLERIPPSPPNTLPLSRLDPSCLPERARWRKPFTDFCAGSQSAARGKDRVLVASYREADVNAPLVSIVIPCFVTTPAQQALLDETLRTVQAQGLTEYEVIVVD